MKRELTLLSSILLWSIASMVLSFALKYEEANNARTRVFSLQLSEGFRTVENMGKKKS